MMAAAVYTASFIKGVSQNPADTG